MLQISMDKGACHQPPIFMIFKNFASAGRKQILKATIPIKMGGENTKKNNKNSV